MASLAVNEILDSSLDNYGLTNHEEDEQYQGKDTAEKPLSWLHVNPDGYFKTIWDNLNLVLILYVATVTPFKLGFLSNFEFFYWDLVDYAVDLFFVMDIVVTLMTPITARYELERSHWEIAVSYLRFWFWLDVLSVIPFDLIFSSSFLGLSFLTTFLKLPRFYKLTKISRLTRTFRLRKKQSLYIFKQIYDSMGSSEQFILSILPLYLSVFLLAHIFSCFWYYQAFISSSDENWLNRSGYRGEDLHDQYWASMYYIYGTLTTTGYGDILPSSEQEFLLTIIFMAVGVTFHSYIYTHMLRKFRDASSTNAFFNEKKELLR